MITDMIDLAAGPKQREAAPQKDDTQAAEDQTTFAQQLAANDSQDKQAQASETNPVSVPAEEINEVPVTTGTDTDVETASEDTDVSLQLFTQTVSGDVVETPAEDTQVLSAPPQIVETADQGTATAEDLQAAKTTLSNEDTATVPLEGEADSAQPKTDMAATTAPAKGATGSVEQHPMHSATAADAETPDVTAKSASTEAPMPNQAAATTTAPLSSDALQAAAATSPTATATMGEGMATGAITATAQAAPTTAPSPTVQIAQAPAAIPVPPQIVGAPEDIPRLITQAMTAEDAADRIVVQLDPPELGRVSLDFKLDAAGVQTVTVTAETPEAIKKLRLMNFELIQAMEQNGLQSGGFSLDYQQSQQSNQYNLEQTFAESGSETSDTESVMTLTETALYRNIQAGQTGLNLKL